MNDKKNEFGFTSKHKVLKWVREKPFCFIKLDLSVDLI